MTEELENYILKHSDDEGALLATLRRDAFVHLLRPRMVSGHLQGRVLKMFCRMMRPKHILEIGTYTGYATLCLAEGLTDGADVHTLEMDDEMEDFIHKYMDQSPLHNRIHLHMGDALQFIPTFDENFFDLVFIDADKRHYEDYFEAVFSKVRPGGLILADNTLWDGKVVQTPAPRDPQSVAIMRFNETIKKDTRIEKVILPMRDGLTLMWKK